MLLVQQFKFASVHLKESYVISLCPARSAARLMYTYARACKIKECTSEMATQCKETS